MTKDVPGYALMVGVPAIRVGWVCECGNKLTVQDSKLECTKCKREYMFLDKEQELIKKDTNQHVQKARLRIASGNCPECPT